MSEFTHPHYCPCCGEAMPATEAGDAMDAPCPCSPQTLTMAAPLSLVDPPRRQLVAEAHRRRAVARRLPRLTRTTRKPPPAPAAGSASTAQQHQPLQLLRLAA